MPHSVKVPNKAQAETLDMLQGKVENLQHDWEGTDIVFTGDGQDGPCCGYILPSGRVHWLVEA